MGDWRWRDLGIRPLVFPSSRSDSAVPPCSRASGSRRSRLPGCCPGDRRVRSAGPSRGSPRAPGLRGPRGLGACRARRALHASPHRKPGPPRGSPRFRRRRCAGRTRRPRGVPGRRAAGAGADAPVVERPGDAPWAAQRVTLRARLRTDLGPESWGSPTWSRRARPWPVHLGPHPPGLAGAALDARPLAALGDGAPGDLRAVDARAPRRGRCRGAGVRARGRAAIRARTGVGGPLRPQRLGPRAERERPARGRARPRPRRAARGDAALGASAGAAARPAPARGPRRAAARLGLRRLHRQPATGGPVGADARAGPRRSSAAAAHRRPERAGGGREPPPRGRPGVGAGPLAPAQLHCGAGAGVARPRLRALVPVPPPDPRRSRRWRRALEQLREALLGVCTASAAVTLASIPWSPPRSTASRWSAGR
jgi:hypothetical protein